jgi:type I restriction enzyme, S subunit
MISLKFIPLTFITSNDEIIRQIKNTVVFSHLFETCQETTFNNYIETTQYGFTASALENGSHKMLRITDIHHSKVNWESVPFCDCPDDEKYLLKDNDILVARTGGTTGKSFFVENPPSNAVFASYLIRIRLKKDVNIEFINAFLNSYCFWSQIVEMKAGSAQPNVNAEKLKTLIIPECDLETQAKTVRLITEENGSGSIRAKINSVETLFWNNNQISTELNHQLALVKELRQAFLSEAMQGKLVPQDDGDEPAEILLEKIKAEKEKLVAEKRIRRDKPLPPINAEEIPFEIPSNWTWCRLIEISELKSGNQYKYSLSENGVMYVRVGDMNLEGNEYEITISSNYFDRNEVKERDLIPVRSIIFPKRGGAIATNKRRVVAKEPILVDSNTMSVTPTENINFSYFLHWFNTIDLSQTGNVNIIPQVNNKDLEPLMIPLPPLAEQERIVAKLEKLMKFCDELEANIRQGIKNADQLLQTALKEALEPKEIVISNQHL